MLKIKEIKDKKIWEEFLLIKEIGFYPLFQSWNWGEVQKKAGFEILRLGLFDTSSKELLGVCLIIEIKAKRGHYFHLRHGPVFLNFKSDHFDFLISEIKKIAKEKEVSFLRVSPLFKKEDLEKEFFKKRKFLSSPIHNLDAEICWILDITKSEDQLLKDLRKTHRYLIRKSQNMDIKILRTQKISEMNKFMELYKDLSERKHFVPHKAVREELEIFGKDDQVLMFFAEYQKKIVAGTIIIFVGDMAIYHHGASLDKFKDIPSSYILQWEGIKEAKKRGKKIYNFWGIAPDNKPDHPWKGLTMFKKGFGGQQIEFIHAQDLPLNFWYWQTYLIESFSKWRKGY